jgi:hypothetical protein
MMDKNKMFQCIFDAYVLAYPKKSKKICQEEVVEKWTQLKSDLDLHLKAEVWLQELKAIAAAKKGSLLTFWAKQTSVSTSTNKKTPYDLAKEIPNTNKSLKSDEKVNDAHEVSDFKPSTSKPSTSKQATVQINLQSEIEILNSDLVGLYARQTRGMLTQEQNMELKEKKQKKSDLEKS